MQTAAAAHRRAAPVLTPLGAGAVLLAALVCLLHALYGGAAAPQAAERAPVAASAAAVADGHLPDPGPHHHPASLVRRTSTHIGPQHRAFPPSGHASCAGGVPAQPPAGSPRGPGFSAGPAAAVALPRTVLRC